MLQITVEKKTYLLAADAGIEETKQAVLDAVRAATAFLSFRTILGGQVEVLVTTTSSIVLEQHDEAPLPDLPRGHLTEFDDDIYGMDYI